VEAFFTVIQYSYYGEGAMSYDFSFAEADKISSVTLPTSYNGTTIPRAGRDPNAYSLQIENGKRVVFKHSLTSLYTVRKITLVLQQIEDPTKREVIHIVQHPAIELVRHSTKNAFVNGYFGRATKDVRDGAGNLIGKDPFTPYYTPDPENKKFYHSTTSANPTSSWASGASTTSRYISLNTSTLGNLGTVNGSIQTSAKDCYTFEITVSAFNDDNNKYTVVYSNANTYNGSSPTTYTRSYRIGDPRVPVSRHYSSSEASLPKYLFSDKSHRDPVTDAVTTGVDSLRAWEEPMKILIANQSVSANEVIAPRFLVSSPLNVMYGNITHLSSVKRAMSYQEDGYPAGRWRLPTEAEIAFIVARQNEGVIPWLFAATYYHCANGKVFYVQSAGSASTPVATDTTKAYNRFVYDLWYWGDEKMDPNVYHPNMHEH
ncbi:MAG: hypothetical protein IKR30_06700, partial [Bacteroidales bacterium]|nr:hypothetical protein [Bacteroidales bacterium]